MTKINHLWKNQMLSLPAFVRGCGLVTSGWVKSWMGTLDFQAFHHDPMIDPAFNHVDSQKYIYLFWHEYILFQLYLRGGCDICMLVSPNRDGEILTEAAKLIGFDVVRGSSNTGSFTAIRSLLRAAATNHLTMTPDGPRGPRRHLANGPIYLASKLQLPIVTVGMGYDQPWRLRTWDQFAIPRPFSRARCVTSEPIYVPKRMASPDFQEHRRMVEASLRSVTLQAETWATTGVSIVGQTDLFATRRGDGCRAVGTKTCDRSPDGRGTYRAA